MERTSFVGMNCSVARTLEVIGDWWSLLIVREAFWGTRRFDDFQKHLGVSRNILTKRLQKLEADEILLRRPVSDAARRLEYVLTDRGRDLFPVLMALMQWGDRWQGGQRGAPVVMHAPNGEPIAELRVRDTQGRVLAPREVRPQPGPGAVRQTRQRLAAIAARVTERASG